MAFAVRVYMVVTADVITPDGLLYIRIARLIEAGNWKAVYEDGFYSTYPFVIVVFRKVFPDWEMAGRMASTFLGSLAVLPFFLLLRRAFDMKIAVVASIFFVLSPRLVQYSSDVLREPLFWCCSLASLWAAWEGIEGRKWAYMVLASLFAGLAAFTRTEGLALIPIIILWTAWALLYRERKALWCLGLLLVFLASFPVIFIGPLHFLKSKTGHWELGQIGTKIPDVLEKGENAALQTTGKDSAEGRSLFTRVANNRYVSSLWETSCKYFKSFHVVLIVLLCFGIVRRRTIPYSDRETLFLIWFLVYLLLTVSYAFKVSYVSTRHGLLMGIPSLLWVSIGFWELSSRLERLATNRRWNAKLTRHIAVWFLLLVCFSIIPKTLQSADRGKTELRTAGIYLKGAGYGEERFVVEPRISRVTFYKGGEFINIPPGIDYSALGPFLRASGARFLVVDERTIDEWVKGFSGHRTGLGLERVDLPEFKNYKEYSFAVYRIRDHQS